MSGSSGTALVRSYVDQRRNAVAGVGHQRVVHETRLAVEVEGHRLGRDEVPVQVELVERYAGVVARVRGGRERAEAIVVVEERRRIVVGSVWIGEQGVEVDVAC